MTSIAYVENETPEQRQVRIAQAMEGHARREAEMRAEEAARVKKASTPPTPKAPPTNPFTDPNYALRQLNEYFGSLRKDYGVDAIRGAGFTPRDLSLMQASLRKLQMDPNATPEQHRQAYQQARDALAQKITTPLAAARPTPSAPPVGTPPEVEVRGVRPPDGVGAPMTGVTPQMPTPPQIERPEMPVMAVRPEMPDTRALEAEKAAEAARDPYAKPRPSNYVVVGERGGHPVYGPPPVTPPAPVPSATDYIASMVTPPRPAPDVMRPTVDPGFNIPSVALPGGTGYDERGNMLKSQPKPTLGDMMKGVIGSMPPQMQPTPTMPSTAPGILPGVTPMTPPMQPSMNTQPGADFDRNVARQIFDAEFRTLREKYGDDGLRAAGFTPRTLSALQAPLTNVQKDNTISYDQSSAALENALQQLRGYNFGGAQPAAAPAAPTQPAAPLPAGAQQSPIPGYYRGGPAMRYR